MRLSLRKLVKFYTRLLNLMPAKSQILHFHQWARNAIQATIRDETHKSSNQQKKILTWEELLGEIKRSQEKWAYVARLFLASHLMLLMLEKKYHQRSVMQIIRSLWRAKKSKLTKRQCVLSWLKKCRGKKDQSRFMSSLRKNCSLKTQVMERRTRMWEGLLSLMVLIKPNHSQSKKKSRQEAMWVFQLNHMNDISPVFNHKNVNKRILI